MADAISSDALAKGGAVTRDQQLREIRDIMWHPMTFWEIVLAKSGRYHNMLYYLFGVVPPSLCTFLLKIMVKRYHL